jgi:hypothetical protein
MVDIETYYSEMARKQAHLPPLSRIGPPILMGGNDQQVWNSDCQCERCRGYPAETSESNYPFEYCDRKTIVEAPELTNHEYLLCPEVVPAFVFKTRSWGITREPTYLQSLHTNQPIEILFVSEFTTPSFRRDMIESLVMDEEKLRTLKSLAESFARIDQSGKALSEAPWAADYVQAKGNGLIFLLHGAPGVGKTFTAGKFWAYR